MKHCKRCFIEKSLEMFSRHKNHKDGTINVCKSCKAELTRIWCVANPEKRKLGRKKWDLENPEKAKASKEKWDIKNKEKKLAKGKIWASRNKERINKRERNRYAVNGYKKAASTRMRQAAKKLATPKWLTKEQKEEMKNKYKNAFETSKSTGIPHEVDHIIPINGGVVVGLHVPWNLRVITREENRIKSNSVFNV